MGAPGWPVGAPGQPVGAEVAPGAAGRRREPSRVAAAPCQPVAGAVLAGHLALGTGLAAPSPAPGGALPPGRAVSPVRAVPRGLLAPPGLVAAAGLPGAVASAPPISATSSSSCSARASHWACSAASESAAARICCIAESTWSAADFCCWAARIDSCSICEVAAISSATSRACRVPCSVAMIVALVWSCTSAMISPTGSVERIDRSASLRTSAATTANPLPASPARAASIAAFSASRFVCPAISLTRSSISPIFCARSPSETARAAMVSTCSCMSCMVPPVCSAAVATARTLSVIAPAVVASCWAVAEIWATAADCSVVVTVVRRANPRRSAATSPSTAAADRSRTSKASRSESRPSASISVSSRWLARRSALCT
jgi:hypothetical protein